jgi:hypothetical protein
MALNIMYRPDLSNLNLPPWNSARYLSVGWLDVEHQYSRGTVPDKDIEQLWKLCIHPKVTTRGFHECPFCPPTGKSTLCYRAGREKYFGSGMIFLKNGGKTYVAPDLIYHFVTAHEYLPPAEFIEIVSRSNNWLRRLAVKFECCD